MPPVVESEGEQPRDSGDVGDWYSQGLKNLKESVDKGGARDEPSRRVVLESGPPALASGNNGVGNIGGGQIRRRLLLRLRLVGFQVSHYLRVLPYYCTAAVSRARRTTYCKILCHHRHH